MKPETVEAEIVRIEEDKQEGHAAQIQRKTKVVGLCVCIAKSPPALQL